MPAIRTAFALDPGPPSAPGKALARLAPALAPRRSRILLAEDDDQLRELLALVLRADGHEVVEAVHGRQLLDALHAATGLGRGVREPLSLVVSDVRMPGMSGLDVLSFLRLGAFAVPFVLITAFGDEPTHLRARELGAAAVLDKPFDLDEFRAVVTRQLGSGRERGTRRPPPASC